MWKVQQAHPQTVPPTALPSLVDHYGKRVARILQCTCELIVYPVDTYGIDGIELDHNLEEENVLSSTDSSGGMT